MAAQRAGNMMSDRPAEPILDDLLKLSSAKRARVPARLTQRGERDVVVSGRARPGTGACRSAI